jgi:hypothetical protein
MINGNRTTISCQLQQEKAPASLEGTNTAEKQSDRGIKVDGRTSVLKELAERKTEVSDNTHTHQKEDKETSKSDTEKKRPTDPVPKGTPKEGGETR